MNYHIVYQLIQDSQDLRDRVAHRVYPERAPKGTAVDYVVIRHVSGNVEYSLQNEIDCANPTFQLDYYAKTATLATSGFRLLRNRLSAYRGTVTVNVDGTPTDIAVDSILCRRPGIVIEEPIDGSDQWTIRSSSVWEMFYQQSVPTHV